MFKIILAQIKNYLAGIYPLNFWEILNIKTVN